MQRFRSIRKLQKFSSVHAELCYLWRVVDHEGEVLELVVTAKRDKAAALKLPSVCP